MNWRTWSVGAVDENGQPFAFIVHARDRAEALSEAEPDIRGLRVTTAQPI